MRCNREVLYARVPYLIGKQGQYKWYEIDRFWGLEISFPPELDDYFHVRFIKRGAEPINELKQFIRDEITPAIIYARNEIRRVFKEEKESSNNNLSETLSSFFRSKKSDVSEITIEEFNGQIDSLFVLFFSDHEFKDIIDNHMDKNRESIKINLMKHKFSISFTELPKEKLFVFDEKDDYNIIIINSNHEYVKHIVYQSIDMEASGDSNIRLFESQIAALISPLIVIERMNKEVEVSKGQFSSIYSKVLVESVIKNS